MHDYINSLGYQVKESDFDKWVEMQNILSNNDCSIRIASVGHTFSTGYKVAISYKDGCNNYTSLYKAARLDKCDSGQWKSAHSTEVFGQVSACIFGFLKDLAKKPFFNKDKCPRCSGTGFVLHGIHVNNGICFNCKGLGFTQ